jgi:hypothetical protein
VNPVVAKAFGDELSAIQRKTKGPVYFKDGLPVHRKGEKAPKEAPYVDSTERKPHSFVEEENRTKIG